MKKGSITKFKLNPKKPPKTDWRAFDAMSDEERRQAALSDPDSPPATEAQLARARRVPTVRALRQRLKLTQEKFAARSISRSALSEIGSRARIAPTRRHRCF